MKLAGIIYKFTGLYWYKGRICRGPSKADIRRAVQAMSQRQIDSRPIVIFTSHKPVPLSLFITEEYKRKVIFQNLEHFLTHVLLPRHHRKQKYNEKR